MCLFVQNTSKLNQRARMRARRPPRRRSSASPCRPAVDPFRAPQQPPQAKIRGVADEGKYPRQQEHLSNRHDDHQPHRLRGEGASRRSRGKPDSDWCRLRHPALPAAAVVTAVRLVDRDHARTLAANTPAAATACFAASACSGRTYIVPFSQDHMFASAPSTPGSRFASAIFVAAIS